MSKIHLHQPTTSTPEQFMTTTDSNVPGGASGHTYTFTRRPEGMTDLDGVVVREGKNIKGRVLGLGLFGERVLGRELEKSVMAMEERNGTSSRSAN
jgi:hypothetical protein